MSITSRRIDKGWTQEQLAEAAGLSVRTVQRIEGGNSANLESLKCFAAVFETDVAALIKEQEMQNEPRPSATTDLNDKRYLEEETIEYVKQLKTFYTHIVVFIIVTPCLVALNAWISYGIWWVVFAILPWAFAIAMHALTVFGFLNLLGPKWEQRQFQKRMREHERNRTGR